MGSKPLSSAAMNADPAPFDRRTQDVGNIIEFGHLNMRVPDQLLAVQFYITGLGLTRDPFMQTGVTNAWVNVGSSQFHLPLGKAQVLRGSIHLVLPDPAAVARRLAALQPALAHTALAFEPQGEDTLVLSCPWGNRIVVHAPDAARFGALRVGMPWLELHAPAGTAAGIVRFYAQLLGARAGLEEDAQGVMARITAGPRHQLVYRETPQPLPAYDGHHVQITVADFSGVHQRLRDWGLVSEESNASQYRFAQLVDPDDGRPLLQLEHEVRSMHHPQFGRVLVNRPQT